MAKKPASALLGALVLGCAVLGICPWENQGQGSSLTASAWGLPLSERGIACPIDDR